MEVGAHGVTFTQKSNRQQLIELVCWDQELQAPTVPSTRSSQSRTSEEAALSYGALADLDSIFFPELP